MMPTQTKVVRPRVIEINDEVPVSVPAVMGLARRVRALIEKGDKAAEKAEQFYKAAGIHIKEIKEQCPQSWEGVVQRECDIGRSRAYELMAIADGRTTLEKVRAQTNERQKAHKAKSESVTNGRNSKSCKQDSVTDAIADGVMGDSCLMRVLAEEARPSDDDGGSEEVAAPEVIKDNVLYSLERMNEHARVFKKLFKLSAFDRDDEATISAAIDEMILKWRSTQAALTRRSHGEGQS
jgi:hypothetical protein